MSTSKPKISVVIPYYESDPGKAAILKRCTDSLQGHSELIVVWNDRMGYAKPINKGLALAKGDYIIVLNDDLFFYDELTGLCQPDAVTGPVLDGRTPEFWGCAFCIPRWVYEKVGPMDERYRISYYDDVDYWYSLKAAGVPVRCVTSVHGSHPQPGRTLTRFSDSVEFGLENKQRFIDKWGQEPIWPPPEGALVPWSPSESK